jgi:hypothetical protein
LLLLHGYNISSRRCHRASGLPPFKP